MRVFRFVLLAALCLTFALSVMPAAAQVSQQPPFVCPAGTVRVDVVLAQQTLTSDGFGGFPTSRNHVVNVPFDSAGGTLFVNTMVGHPNLGCQQGPSNDAIAGCDQGQVLEHINVSVNGLFLAPTIPDHGEDQWQQFSRGVPSLNNGNNTFTFAHASIGAPGINSVDYTAVLCVIPAPPTGTEGCTPGYWKQSHHYDSWFGYSPNQSFNSVFGVGPHTTLGAALALGGGGQNALMRHAVAALLNAANPNVDYPYTTGQVIAIVEDAFETGHFEAAKNDLEDANELGCPLN